MKLPLTFSEKAAAWEANKEKMLAESQAAFIKRQIADQAALEKNLRNLNTDCAMCGQPRPPAVLPDDSKSAFEIARERDRLDQIELARQQGRLVQEPVKK